MKPLKPNIQSYQIANIIMFIAIVIVFAINAIISSRLVKTIQTTNQQSQTEQVNYQASIDQVEFFNQNPQLLTTIEAALPDQTGIIKLIEKVETLQKDIGVSQSFSFTSTKPSQEQNQFFLPFTIRFNANYQKTIDFLRNFEKLPYLTKITSLNIKSPSGISGIYEVSITGRVYVQDAFKNQ